ncbi:hypothetical protein JQ629_32395 [Bradyrhizobium sp. AUGA SZCCT0222]|uniref:hypothetical protein n=1 Tax=Bradyrhizobium sp. AUGA SZCCT0222 TaxID=2807668 RepID=UPI001BAA7920|nr:hypothetical protein [Bradyrhizobium sp. AUGA SZCCT0222]MBR1272185.1 hypothetical protein [Bradyrhizobium sp. AUGA SZCCT0222]
MPPPYLVGTQQVRHVPDVTEKADLLHLFEIAVRNRVGIMIVPCGFLRTRLRNVAIGVGSPLTGLAIIASYPKLPRVIVVETNILSRPVDATLVQNFGNTAAEPFAWFWRCRVAISSVHYWLKYKSESHNVATLPQQPPSSYDIKTSLDETGAEYANPAQVCVRHTRQANCRSLNPGELAHDQAARREQNVRLADSDFDRGGAAALAP